MSYCVNNRIDIVKFRQSNMIKYNISNMSNLIGGSLIKPLKDYKIWKET